MSKTQKTPSLLEYKTPTGTLFYRSLLLRAMVAGKARWEPYAAGDVRGEVCIGELRFSTRLDEAGCPLVSGPISAALYSECGGFPTR